MYFNVLLSLSQNKGFGGADGSCGWLRALIAGVFDIFIVDSPRFSPLIMKSLVYIYTRRSKKIGFALHISSECVVSVHIKKARERFSLLKVDGSSSSSVCPSIRLSAAVRREK
jgi:hypothetical protein